MPFHVAMSAIAGYFHLVIEVVPLLTGFS